MFCAESIELFAVESVDGVVDEFALWVQAVLYSLNTLHMLEAQGYNKLLWTMESSLKDTTVHVWVVFLEVQHGTLARTKCFMQPWYRVFHVSLYFYNLKILHYFTTFFATVSVSIPCYRVQCFNFNFARPSERRSKDWSQHAQIMLRSSA